MKMLRAQSKKRKVTAALVITVVLMLMTILMQANSNSTYGQQLKHQHTIDTTELLVAGPWHHIRRGFDVYDSTFVRKFHYMKEGKYKIEINKGKSNERISRGVWRRKGSKIFSELEPYQGEHEHEIARLTRDTLYLYFVDRRVMDVMVRK